MDANAATHLEELEVHGYTIIPDLMSEDRLSQAREKCED